MTQAAGGVGEGLGGGDGGPGAAGDRVNGDDGLEKVNQASRDSGGGGGGAGRIRINAMSLQVDGILSPSESTQASSFGSLLFSVD